jgi:SAM-dependent methyltransferase
VTGERFELCRCGRCALAVTLPRPADAAMASYYPAEYYRSGSSRRFPAPVERLQRALYARRARRVEALAGGAGRVLDVGCGPGFLLDAFRRRGWQAEGTELSDASASHARERLSLPVHVGPIDSWPWPEGHFDAVSMWHVLEHFPDPGPLLHRIGRLLRPGGVAMVGVPDFGSAEARLARAGWFHLDVPRHLCHFTPASLGAALAAQGLVARSRSGFAPEYDLFSFVQSLENLVGLPANLLYQLLRRASAPSATRRAGAARCALALLLALPLSLLALPATPLLSLLARGSSMTVLAVKELGP